MSEINILYVDDAVSNQKMGKNLINKYFNKEENKITGHEINVVVVGSCKDAIEHWKALMSNGKQLDVLLLDYDLTQFKPDCPSEEPTEQVQPVDKDPCCGKDITSNSLFPNSTKIDESNDSKNNGGQLAKKFIDDGYTGLIIFVTSFHGDPNIIDINEQIMKEDETIKEFFEKHIASKEGSKMDIKNISTIGGKLIGDALGRLKTKIIKYIEIPDDSPVEDEPSIVEEKDKLPVSIVKEKDEPITPAAIVDSSVAPMPGGLKIKSKTKKRAKRRTLKKTQKKKQKRTGKTRRIQKRRKN